MPVLSEKTLIPLSAVAAIAWLVFWLATVAVRANATADDFEKYKAERAQYDAAMLDLVKRVERIDARVDYIYESIRQKQRANSR